MTVTPGSSLSAPLPSQPSQPSQRVSRKRRERPESEVSAAKQRRIQGAISASTTPLPAQTPPPRRFLIPRRTQSQSEQQRRQNLLTQQQTQSVLGRHGRETEEAEVRVVRHWSPAEQDVLQRLRLLQGREQECRDILSQCSTQNRSPSATETATLREYYQMIQAFITARTNVSEARYQALVEQFITTNNNAATARTFCGHLALSVGLVRAIQNNDPTSYCETLLKCDRVTLDVVYKGYVASSGREYRFSDLNRLIAIKQTLTSNNNQEERNLLLRNFVRPLSQADAIAVVQALERDDAILTNASLCNDIRDLRLQVQFNSIIRDEDLRRYYAFAHTHPTEWHRYMQWEIDDDNPYFGNLHDLYQKLVAMQQAMNTNTPADFEHFLLTHYPDCLIPTRLLSETTISDFRTILSSRESIPANMFQILKNHEIRLLTKAAIQELGQGRYAAFIALCAQETPQEMRRCISELSQSTTNLPPNTPERASTLINCELAHRWIQNIEMLTNAFSSNSLQILVNTPIVHPECLGLALAVASPRPFSLEQQLACALLKLQWLERQSSRSGADILQLMRELETLEGQMGCARYQNLEGVAQIDMRTFMNEVTLKLQHIRQMNEFKILDSEFTNLRKRGPVTLQASQTYLQQKNTRLLSLNTPTFRRMVTEFQSTAMGAELRDIHNRLEALSLLNQLQDLETSYASKPSHTAEEIAEYHRKHAQYMTALLNIPSSTQQRQELYAIYDLQRPDSANFHERLEREINYLVLLRAHSDHQNRPANDPERRVNFEALQETIPDQAVISSLFAENRSLWTVHARARIEYLAGKPPTATTLSEILNLMCQMTDDERVSITLSSDVRHKLEKFLILEHLYRVEQRYPLALRSTDAVKREEYYTQRALFLNKLPSAKAIYTEMCAYFPDRERFLTNMHTTAHTKAAIQELGEGNHAAFVALCAQETPQEVRRRIDEISQPTNTLPQTTAGRARTLRNCELARSWVQNIETLTSAFSSNSLGALINTPIVHPECLGFALAIASPRPFSLEQQYCCALLKLQWFERQIYRSDEDILRLMHELKTLEEQMGCARYQDMKGIAQIGVRAFMEEVTTRLQHIQQMSDIQTEQVPPSTSAPSSSSTVPPATSITKSSALTLFTQTAAQKPLTTHFRDIQNAMQQAIESGNSCAELLQAWKTTSGHDTPRSIRFFFALYCHDLTAANVTNKTSKMATMIQDFVRELNLTQNGPMHALMLQIHAAMQETQSLPHAEFFCLKLMGRLARGAESAADIQTHLARFLFLFDHKRNELQATLNTAISGSTTMPFVELLDSMQFITRTTMTALRNTMHPEAPHPNVLENPMRIFENRYADQVAKLLIRPGGSLNRALIQDAELCLIPPETPSSHRSDFDTYMANVLMKFRIDDPQNTLNRIFARLDTFPLSSTGEKIIRIHLGLSETTPITRADVQKVRLATVLARWRQQGSGTCHTYSLSIRQRLSALHLVVDQQRELLETGSISYEIQGRQRSFPGIPHSFRYLLIQPIVQTSSTTAGNIRQNLFLLPHVERACRLFKSPLEGEAAFISRLEAAISIAQDTANTSNTKLTLWAIFNLLMPAAQRTPRNEEVFQQACDLIAAENEMPLARTLDNAIMELAIPPFEENFDSSTHSAYRRFFCSLLLTFKSYALRFSTLPSTLAAITHITDDPTREALLSSPIPFSLLAQFRLLTEINRNDPSATDPSYQLYVHEGPDLIRVTQENFAEKLRNLFHDIANTMGDTAFANLLAAPETVTPTGMQQEMQKFFHIDSSPVVSPWNFILKRIDNPIFCQVVRPEEDEYLFLKKVGPQTVICNILQQAKSIRDMQVTWAQQQGISENFQPEILVPMFYSPLTSKDTPTESPGHAYLFTAHRIPSAIPHDILDFDKWTLERTRELQRLPLSGYGNTKNAIQQWARNYITGVPDAIRQETERTIEHPPNTITTLYEYIQHVQSTVQKALYDARMAYSNTDEKKRFNRLEIVCMQALHRDHPDLTNNVLIRYADTNYETRVGNRSVPQDFCFLLSVSGKWQHIMLSRDELWSDATMEDVPSIAGINTLAIAPLRAPILQNRLMHVKNEIYHEINELKSTFTLSWNTFVEEFDNIPDSEKDDLRELLSLPLPHLKLQLQELSTATTYSPAFRRCLDHLSTLIRHKKRYEDRVQEIRTAQGVTREESLVVTCVEAPERHISHINEAFFTTDHSQFLTSLRQELQEERTLPPLL